MLNSLRSGYWCHAGGLTVRVRSSTLGSTFFFSIPVSVFMGSISLQKTGNMWQHFYLLFLKPALKVMQSTHVWLLHWTLISWNSEPFSNRSTNLLWASWGAIMLVMDYKVKLLMETPTVSGESQLSADHTSIRCIPEIITHSAPCVVQANLNTALGRIGSRSCQSDCMLHTASCVQILD